MGIIREPLYVDFEVDPRPLTKVEKDQISSYIKAYKAKHSKKETDTRQPKKSDAREKVVG